jgi:hypothetical protein
LCAVYGSLHKRNWNNLEIELQKRLYVQSAEAYNLAFVCVCASEKMAPHTEESTSLLPPPGAATVAALRTENRFKKQKHN